jgi:four helix bundle protein
MADIKSYRDLHVYQNAMDAVMLVFEITKTFPREERYSLVDQVRRCSRSTCSNIAEAWRKRRYEAAFVAKLSDADTEAAETQVQLEIAWRAGYIDKVVFQDLDGRYEIIIGQIVKMIDRPEKWLIKRSRSK